MMNKVILFLDDCRKASNYVDTVNNIVRQSFTYNEFTVDVQDYFFLYVRIDEVWFGHDLGGPNGDGYDCAKYLVKFCDENGYKLPKWCIQSANTIKNENGLIKIIKNENI